MISIALATYNGEKYLAEQLNSLLSQTRKPDELIVCDDRSSDNSVEVINAFACIAPFPVRIFVNEKRLGYRENFMKAAGLCNSDYIAFCDQDDVWDAKKIEVVLEAAWEGKWVFLQHGFRLIDKLGVPMSGDIEYAPPDKAGPWAHSLGLTQIFHRSLLKYRYLWETSIDHTRPGERMSHDQWTSFLAPLVGPTMTLRQPLLSYRQHTANALGYQPHTIVNKGIFRRNLGLLLSRFLEEDHGYRAQRKFLQDRFRRMAAGSNARHQIVDKLIQDGSESDLALLNKTAEFYKQTYTSYTKRLQVYTTPSRFSRFRIFVSLYFNFSVREWDARRIKDLALDFVYGVLGPAV